MSNQCSVYSKLIIKLNKKKNIQITSRHFSAPVPSMAPYPTSRPVQGEIQSPCHLTALLSVSLLSVHLSPSSLLLWMPWDPRYSQRGQAFSISGHFCFLPQTAYDPPSHLIQISAFSSQRLSLTTTSHHRNIVLPCYIFLLGPQHAG